MNTEVAKDYELQRSLRERTMQMRSDWLARTFELWQYSVGHGELLLRSPKSSRCSTRVSILFTNVASLSSPTCFEGLAIRLGDASVVDPRSLGLLGLGSRQVYLIAGASWRGYVVAGSVASAEDEAEYNDPVAHFDRLDVGK